jgi:hypothetical protein
LDLPPYVIRFDQHDCAFAGTQEQLSLILSDDQFPTKPKRVNYGKVAFVKAHRAGIFTAHFHNLTDEDPYHARIKGIAKAILDGNSPISNLSKCMLQLWRLRVYLVMRGDWSAELDEKRRKTMDDAYDRFLISAMELMIHCPLESEQIGKS